MAFISSGKEFDREKHQKKMKAYMGNIDIVQYSLRVPSDLHHKVKVKAAKTRTSFREVLISMLLKYIEEK